MNDDNIKMDFEGDHIKTDIEVRGCGLDLYCSG
jgi:hypothetical protein